KTEITSSTSVMLLESAHFGWRSIRRTSRRLNLVTEASYRFERVVDPDGVVAAADRVCELLAELGMGRPVPGVVDVYPLPPSPRTISVRPERVGRLLGYEVSADEVADALTRLGFSVTGIAGIPSPRVRERHSERCEESACAGIAGIASPRVRERHSERCEESACAGIAGIASPRVRGEGQAPSIPSPRVRGEGQGEGLVTVPNRRPDILRETDLVEEVGRVVGYDRIPERLPAGPTSQGRDTDLAALADAIRDRLVGAGLQEVVGHSLGAPSPFDDPASDHQRIPIRSALSDELSGLRRTLLPSLLDALDRNARRGQGPLAFFEVGAVFAASRSADVPHIPSPRVRGEGQAPGIPSPRVRGEGQAPSIPSPRVRGEGQGEGRRVQHEERMALGGVVCGPLTPRSRFAGTRPETPMSVAQGLVEMLLASLGLETDFAPSLDARLHPGRQASVAVNGQTIGLFGELHPDLALHLRVRERIGVFELDCAGLQAACRARRPFVPLTPYPAVMRDLAPRVPTSVPFARVRSAVLAAGAPILDELALVDVYSGDRLPEGVRSLTLSLTFRAPDRTLTDADAEPALEAIRSRLRDECGATFVGA
ncbi:MAG: phenylalanine--tRNA ligase subunit beta, partial [Armatimonadetes bacterium]|nr:phenylalanine--tRNA ligase subunit beta [Armatimonadota bacterium]